MTWCVRGDLLKSTRSQGDLKVYQGTSWCWSGWKWMKMGENGWKWVFFCQVCPCELTKPHIYVRAQEFCCPYVADWWWWCQYGLQSVKPEERFHYDLLPQSPYILTRVKTADVDDDVDDDDDDDGQWPLVMRLKRMIMMIAPPNMLTVTIYTLNGIP